MKSLIILMLSLMLLTSCKSDKASSKRDEANIIPTDISFVSTEWIEGRGTYRVIRYNSEVDPCFILQRFKNGLAEGLSTSTRVCQVMLQSELFDVSADTSGGSWYDDFRWDKTGLLFTLDSSSGTFSCSMNLVSSDAIQAQCH